MSRLPPALACGSMAAGRLGVWPNTAVPSQGSAQLGESKDKVCGSPPFLPPSARPHPSHHIPGDVTHPGRLGTSRAPCPSARAQGTRPPTLANIPLLPHPVLPPLHIGGSGEGEGISSFWDSHRNRPSSWPSSPKSFTPEPSYSPWTLQGPGVLWVVVPFEERETRSEGAASSHG